jgi:DNA-binding MarR family transcriptional regulator
MTEDVVRALGHLALGSRLKRISERLQGQTQILLEAEGISLSASFFPLLAVLDRLGALSVGELSQALGVSQPGMTRMLNKLKAEGLVTSQPVVGDRRLRPIMLTPSGNDLVRRAKSSLWPRIESAVADACAGLSGPFLAQLAALETTLATESLLQRAARLTPRESELASH